MWYFLRSDRKAAILLGLKPGVTREQLRRAFAAGTSRDLLQRFRPEPGEAVFLPPGMVHALGPGVVVFEVEEDSDLTYRLDDFGRMGLDGKPRPLHLEKGMDVIRPELPPLRDLPRLEFREKYGLRRFVLASRYFALEELSLRRTAAFCAAPDRVEVLSVVEGEGRIENAAGWLAYRTGETWLIPPGTGFYRLVPALDTRILKFYVPDLDKDFRKPLEQRGTPATTICQIVFD
jgi:mannose-6-phosphate isomerase